jgi:hypothetical protein
MKRRNFIKAFAACCCVPVVAAKAIAASHKKRRRIVFENGSTITLRDVKVYEDPFVGYCDQSGNGNHMLKMSWADGQQGKINMQKFKDEIEFLKPEDAPLHPSIKH